MNWIKSKCILLPASDKLYPKDCIGKLFLNESNVLTKLDDLEDIIKSNAYFGAKPQELYFTSEEEIKDGDWCIDLYKIRNGFYPIFRWNNKFRVDAKKIIATTDKSLYFVCPCCNNGIIEDEPCRNCNGGKIGLLPQPQKEFLETYVKAYNEGRKVKEVLVGFRSSDLNYFSDNLKEDCHNIAIVKSPKESWNRAEVIEIVTRALYAKEAWYQEEIDEWIDKNL